MLNLLRLVNQYSRHIWASANSSVKKTCKELGFNFVLKQVGSALDSSLSDGEGVEEAIIEANNAPNINGIMVSITLFICLFMSSYELQFGRSTIRYLESNKWASALSTVVVRLLTLKNAGSLPPTSAARFPRSFIQSFNSA